MHTAENKTKKMEKNEQWTMKEDGKRPIEQIERDKKEGNNKDKYNN